MTSDRRLSRRGAGGTKADIDRVIDEVARQMTAGAPSGDVRARVLAWISTQDERRATNVRGASLDVRRWVVAPIAAAALIGLAIFVGRRDGGPAAPGVQQSAPPVAHIVPPSTPQKAAHPPTRE